MEWKSPDDVGPDYVDGKLIELSAEEKQARFDKAQAKKAARGPRLIDKWVITERLGGARLKLMDIYFHDSDEGYENQERWRSQRHTQVQVTDPRMIGLLKGVLSMSDAQIDELLRPYDASDPDALAVIA